MTPGGVVAGWFFGSLILSLAWFLWCDLHEHLEDRRCEPDIQREEPTAQTVLDLNGQRLTLFAASMEELVEVAEALEAELAGLLGDDRDEDFEAEALEDLYDLPCAPNPVQRF